ncbi:MAG: AAA family ATPase, partial [Deltaproteobacteria bacterium]|nr:AAA family ATPase [Deltaproteobacteria bacterium]
MLLNLRIRDFAIIDQAEVEFSTGFTVVTGETGAGKSILVDALMLALGARANNEVVRTGADTARVEALFDIKQHPVVRARLEQRELVGDDPALLLISRVIGKKGRNKVLINGHLSTVATLSEIVRGLVDISGQHEQQSLLMTDTHLEILDAYSEIDGLKSRYSKAYASYRRSLKEYAGLQAREDADGQQVDFLRFQLDEIERVNPIE